MAEPQRTKPERYLRAFLKLYFFVPSKWKDYVCSLHLIYVVILVIQIVKLSFLTGQMFLYGNVRSEFNSKVHRGHLTLRHLLLEHWDASWETVPYPPAHGDFAVYTIDNLESEINYAVSRYYNYERDAVGFYKRLSTDSMKATVKYFDFPEAGEDSEITISEKHFRINHGLTNTTTDDEIEYKYSIIDELKYMNLSLAMKRMLTTTLEFTIHSVRPDEETKHALCLEIYGQVIYTDKDNNGQVNVDLKTRTNRIKCAAMNVSVEDTRFENTFKPIGTFVVVFCCISIILTVLSFIFGLIMFVMTKCYMKKNFKGFYGITEAALETARQKTDLPKWEYFRFAIRRFWDILSLISDVLTIIGTDGILSGLEKSEWDLSLLDRYTVRLGVGFILAWLSVLQFFKVHDKLHLLFRTLYRATGDVIAYMICVTVLFVGFWICGYVVLGPYHVKFRTLEAAAQTLFALVNGDEIYATLAMFDKDQQGSNFVWWFASVYIAVYVAIYTIVVINLLIALFLSAYEAIKTRSNDDGNGPLERALKNCVTQQKEGGKLRDAVYELLCSDKDNTENETTLRNELLRILKVNKDTNDLEILKPRTLKTFIRDEEERRKEVNVCCCKLSLAQFIAPETE